MTRFIQYNRSDLQLRLVVAEMEQRLRACRFLSKEANYGEANRTEDLQS